jgi:hypothetical protein
MDNSRKPEEKTLSETQLPDDAVRSYMILMHELAIRIDLVVIACEGRLNLSPPYAREYSYLQFRRCCELIALGSLFLHGDLPLAQTNSVKKEWNADKIMRMLQKAHPHTFPQSVITERTVHGMNIKANAKPEALTFDEFKRLYAECGEVLHRGTIRTVEAFGTPSQADYEKVISWQRKLALLMNEHIVVSANRVDVYLIGLRSPSGFPQCSILTPDPTTGTMKVRQFTASAGANL